MFRIALEYTLMDHLEGYLARWTGKGLWPYTVATLESRVQFPVGDILHHFGLASCNDSVSYEVEQITYTSAIRRAAGFQEEADRVGDTLMIRYDTRNPGTSYYAPACQLANRFVVCGMLAATVVAIALAVWVAQKSA